MHRLAGLDYEERGAGEAVCLVLFEPAGAAKVTAPALMVSGAASRPWFRENAMILAEMLPDARTQTLPELDHLAPLTHPGELASAIGEFLRRCRQGPGAG